MPALASAPSSPADCDSGSGFFIQECGQTAPTKRLTAIEAGADSELLPFDIDAVTTGPCHFPGFTIAAAAVRSASARVVSAYSA